MTEDEEALLAAYTRLGDGLREMIAKGRLLEIDMPDDFDWLKRTLAECDGLHQKVRAFDAKEAS